MYKDCRIDFQQIDIHVISREQNQNKVPQKRNEK